MTTFRKKKHEPTAGEEREKPTGGDRRRGDFSEMTPGSARFMVSVSNSTHHLVNPVKEPLVKQSVQKGANRWLIG